jgi:hypothetical protein
LEGRSGDHFSVPFIARIVHSISWRVGCPVPLTKLTNFVKVPLAGKPRCFLGQAPWDNIWSPMNC